MCIINILWDKWFEWFQPMRCRVGGPHRLRGQPAVHRVLRVQYCAGEAVCSAQDQLCQEEGQPLKDGQAQEGK